MAQIHKLPQDELVSLDYKIKINGIPTEAYYARVSAIPFNRVWPGYQRAIAQTELASFIYFSMEDNEEVEISITVTKPFKEVTVRPLSKNIQSKTDGQTVTFKLNQTGQYTFEPDGFHNALHIFANPVFDFGIDKNAPNVIYFGAGIHNPGVIKLKSNDIVFIDEGAVVLGVISAKDADGIRIFGTGILDGSWEERHGAVGCMRFTNCTNISIKGIICRDSVVWTVNVFNCTNVVIDNIKLIGMWRYNSDGIDLVNSTNCVIKNSFLRNFDDCVVLKGLKGHDHRNVENIYVTNCVIWCDWGRGLELGAETCADEFRNIIFEDCDLIHGMHIQLDIQNGDRASIHDVIFQNIRIEYSKYTLNPVYQHTDDQIYEHTSPRIPELFYAHIYNGMWSKDMLYGENYNITFKNIYVQLDDGLPLPESVFVGVNEEHQTYNITIDGLYFNGKKINDISEIPVKTNEFTHDVKLI